VEGLVVKRDLSRNALFDAMFVLQNTEMAELKMKGLKFEPYETRYDIAKLDLTLTGEEVAGKLHFTIEYCTKLFRQETMNRLAGHYVNILRAMAENQSLRLNEVEMLSARERLQLIREFNNTEKIYCKERVIQELFEEQVRKSSEKVALVCGEYQLTYRDLNAKANRLARVFGEMG
jgi:non-ribosomal peptide synthetase component F